MDQNLVKAFWKFLLALHSAWSANTLHLPPHGHNSTSTWPSHTQCSPFVYTVYYSNIASVTSKLKKKCGGSLCDLAAGRKINVCLTVQKMKFPSTLFFYYLLSEVSVSLGGPYNPGYEFVFIVDQSSPLHASGSSVSFFFFFFEI